MTAPIDLLEIAKDEMKPDMTPLIDCVFLMIIFFVCIDFRVLEAKLPVYLPRPSATLSLLAAPRELLVVEIRCDAFGRKIDRSVGQQHGQVDPATGRPFAFILVGHQVHYAVGPRRCADVAALRAELQRVHDDPAAARIDAASGKLSLPPVVIEPQAGAVYDDVAKVIDVAKAVGFGEVTVR
jgi:biopolymer transport protein ExbD